MKYGLVLSGGGVRGAYHIGVWKALKELKIDIAAVSGSSIGAINGALLLQESTKAVEKMWSNIELPDIVSVPEDMEIDDNLFKIKNIARLVKEVYKSNGLDMSPLENLLRDIINEDKIRKSAVEFGIMTFSITEKSEVYMFKNDIPKGKLVDYLMASACLPGFKVKTINSKKFIDGAVSNNMPLNMMFDKGINNIIAVDVKGIGFYKTFNLAGKNVINIKCVSPQTGTMEFNRDGIVKSISEGYFDTMKAFGRYSGNLYSYRATEYSKARKKYSKELIDGIEDAADIFGIDKFKLYKVDDLIKETIQEYFKYADSKEHEISESVFDKMRKLDNPSFLVWLVEVLEKGKSDFIKEKLSILGSNYDAASAIMYFKK